METRSEWDFLHLLTLFKLNLADYNLFLLLFALLSIALPTSLLKKKQKNCSVLYALAYATLNSALRVRCLPLVPLAQLSISYLQRHGARSVSGQCKLCNMIEHSLKASLIFNARRWTVTMRRTFLRYNNNYYYYTCEIIYNRLHDIWYRRTTSRLHPCLVPRNVTPYTTFLLVKLRTQTVIY